MSALNAVASDFQRGLGELKGSLSSAGAWRDPQRDRLERARIQPLLIAAQRHAAALMELDTAFDEVERLLRD